MLDPEQRYYIWDGYKKEIDKFFIQVDDDLRGKFAPRNETQDKDAPTVQKFFDILKKLSDFVDAHHKELDREYDDYETERCNLRINFEAWDAGICPKVFRQMWIDERRNIYEFKELCRDFAPREHERVLEVWRESRKVKASA